MGRNGPCSSSGGGGGGSSSKVRVFHSLPPSFACLRRSSVDIWDARKKQLAGAKWLTAFHVGAILLSFGGKSGTCLRRERREEESASTRGPPKNSSTANPSIASVSSWVAPFPPTSSSSSSSSSSPPLLPPFIGSRISKSLVVKNAAALLRSACHARFLPTRTDGRTDGRTCGQARRRNCVSWPRGRETYCRASERQREEFKSG